MTKIENERCEILCLEAIKNLKESSKLCIHHEYWGKADSLKGYAKGIYQSLVFLKYKSDSMIELAKLLN